MSDGFTRRVKYLESKEARLCEHLKLFREMYLNHVKNGEEIPDDLLDVDDTEIAATLPQEKWADVFNEETGQWKFSPKSISQRIVDNDPFSEQLARNLNARDSHNNLYPELPSDSCECGAGWTSDCSPPDGLFKRSFRLKLYLGDKVIDSQVFDRTCVKGTCVRRYDGAENSIFCLSKSTAVGYEIGWEFVDAVMTSKQTFRGFITVVKNRYLRYKRNCEFLSINTFIEFFFAWASRMNLEFRESCSGCEGSPTVLACDGTKLGINFRNTFVSPIETPSYSVSTDFVQTRRHDRCFIVNQGNTVEDKRKYARLRLHLKSYCEGLIKALPYVQTDMDLLKEILPSTCHPSFDAMVCVETNPIHRKALALVYRMLAFDSAVDSILPFDVCQSLLSDIDDYEKTSEIIKSMREYSYELSQLLMVTLGSELFPHVVSLIKCIAGHVIKAHENDIEPEPAQPIDGSYNPPKYGRAYYFNADGKQLRRLRKFPVDDTDTGNYDNAPDIVCEKRFPQVSKKGTSYLFLWFCPNHGHCWGYHIIPGSEGRKDPAASLYMFLEKAPKWLFYDFACSLSEYNHNREAGFYCCTRFYHDILHGFTHKCSNSFRCDKLAGMSSVNSSICEQFNAYIKRIKTSATLMSQVHFNFYLQFFISRWNNMKRETLKKRLLVADAARV